jgi:HlyD family secretion protein
MSVTKPSPRSDIRKLQLAGYSAIVVAVGGFGGWAATSEIAGAVIANGSIVVESNTKKVQHPSGGIVGEILVKEGTEVDAGQVLIRLDDTLTRATLGVIQSQLDLYVAREARLLSERDGLPAIPVSDISHGAAPTEGFAAAIAGERRLFESRRSGLAGQQAQLRERITQIGEEIRGLTAQQESKAKEIDYIVDELAGVEQLYAKNLVSIARLKQLQRDQARLQGERGQLIAEIARSRGKVTETELQVLQLNQDFRTEVLKELRETQARIAELQERASAAADELKRTIIRAPQAGIVYQLQVHTIGGVIGKGDTVMQIAPRADPLIVEAKVAPPDIDQIGMRAPVRVRINAGNRRTTPDLDGIVTYVSPDLANEPMVMPAAAQKQQYYIVRVTLSEAAIRAAGDLQLVQGMPADVYIRTQTRTPVDYLMKPLGEQLARTFRER